MCGESQIKNYQEVVTCKKTIKATLLTIRGSGPKMGKYAIITLIGVVGFIVGLVPVPLWSSTVSGVIILVSIGIFLFGIIGGTISSVRHRKKGGKMRVVQATPDTMPIFGTRPKYTSEDLPKFNGMKNGRIVVDSSVILDVVGFNTDQKIGMVNRAISFLEKNKEKIAVPDVVKSEVDRILLHRGGTQEMYAKMEIFENKTIHADENMLKEIEKIQAEARDGKNINTQQHWLQAKAPYLRKAYGKSFSVTSDNKAERRMWASKLYDEANSDRKILAQAMTLAEKEDVILLSNDGDITTFEGECDRRVSHTLQIGDCYRLPEA